MNLKLKSTLGVAALLMAAQAMANVTFYEAEHFRGRVFATDEPVSNFQRNGFNDRASSVIVNDGRWEVCQDANFKGHCVVLRPGSYDSLNGMGLNDRISSVRPVNDQGHGHHGHGHDRQVVEAPPPLPAPTYEYRRRPNERIYNAPVTSVHAVVGPPNQRCWVEHEKVSAPRNSPNVGGAIIGAVVGGIIGHQIGGGTGKDIATAGGAVAGAAVGSRVGADNSSSTRDVRHCENVPSGPPDFWDVTYYFRNVEHRVQMTYQPGPTISVNENGEPRA